MILNVTPGINLNAVSGPISKSQLNQLGQPVVTLSPGSVVAADTSFSSLRITDGVYPFVHLKNTGAPVDKKNVRAYVDSGGTYVVARVNDAENAETRIIQWTADNKCTVGPNTGANAAVNFGAPALAGTAGSLVEMLRLDGSNGNAASLRVNHLRHTTAGDWTAATMRVQHYVDTTPQGFIDFNPSGLTHGLSLGTCTALQAPVNVLNITGSAAGNNVGIGTTTPLSKLTVAGEIRLQTNGNALLFTDTGGSTPYMVSAVDGNFYFAGTTAAGAAESVFRCAMRATNSPLQIDRPLKIGASGAEIKTVLTTTFDNPIQTITSGATFTHDITLTGVPNPGGGAPCVLNVTPNELDNRVIVRAQTIPNFANTVRLVLYNSSAVSIDLSAAWYRIEATIY